jgi:hypothetical protein
MMYGRANLRSVETRELNRGNPYARSGSMDEHIVSAFDITNQDKSLKSFPCARSAASPEWRYMRPTWEGGVNTRL